MENPLTLDEAFVGLNEIFVSMVKADFTEEQALTVIAKMLSNSTAGDNG